MIQQGAFGEAPGLHPRLSELGENRGRIEDEFERTAGPGRVARLGAIRLEFDETVHLAVQLGDDRLGGAFSDLGQAQITWSIHPRGVRST